MIFEEKLLNIKCVFRVSLQLLSETFLIVRRNERDMIENVKHPLFLSDFNEIWILRPDFWKILKQNFMKIGPVAAKLFHADGWTDRQIWWS